MVAFNVIVTLLFLAWMGLTAWIGWQLLHQMQAQTTRLVSVLMDTVVQTSESAKRSSENAQRVVALLEQRLSEHEHQ